jgi:hypothetical protein
MSNPVAPDSPLVLAGRQEKEGREKLVSVTGAE